MDDRRLLTIVCRQPPVVVAKEPTMFQYAAAEKYGRYLADVIYLPGAKTRDEILAKGTLLNKELIDKGLAVPFMVDG